MKSHFFKRGNQRRWKAVRGFTLIEILLVAALFSVCAIAVFRTFASGLKIWERSQRSAIEEDISIFMDKISADLRQTFYFSKIKFNGMETQLSFAAFVRTPADRNSLQAPDDLVDQMGAVKYYLDYEDHKLYRSQANFAQALHGTFPDKKVLVNAVDGIRFAYYFSDRKGMQAYSKAQEVVPSGVYVEVKYHDENSSRVMSRFISVPTGI